MQESLHLLVKYAGHVGLLNATKTKLMRINTTASCTASIAEGIIEVEGSFCYVGSILGEDKGAGFHLSSLR